MYKATPYREAPYSGTMIDNLIASVQQAEARAGDSSGQMPVPAGGYAASTREALYDNEQLLGVA